MDEIRTRLEALMRARGDDYLALSKLLGRNAAYVQQFMKRGVPRDLHERDRRTLATYFGVDESELGGLDPATRSAPPPVAMVRRLQLGASAGPGTLDAADGADSAFGFDPRWLRQLGAHPARLSIIQVAGDSMMPTLSDGDDIMVDDSESARGAKDGIFVIRHEDTLMVKRLERAGADRVAIVSDNARYPRKDVGADTVEIVGRVIWAARKIR